MNQPFNQPAPALGNQYEDDRVLRSYLRRVLPDDVRREVEPSLAEMGRLAGGDSAAFNGSRRLKSLPNVLRQLSGSISAFYSASFPIALRLST